MFGLCRVDCVCLLCVYTEGSASYRLRERVIPRVRDVYVRTVSEKLTLGT